MVKLLRLLLLRALGEVYAMSMILFINASMGKSFLAKANLISGFFVCFCVFFLAKLNARYSLFWRGQGLLDMDIEDSCQNLQIHCKTTVKSE